MQSDLQLSMSCSSSRSFSPGTLPKAQVPLCSSYFRNFNGNSCIPVFFPQMCVPSYLYTNALGRICQTKLDGLVKTEAETHTKISETYEARPKPATYTVFVCICWICSIYILPHRLLWIVLTRFVWQVFQGEFLEAVLQCIQIQKIYYVELCRQNVYLVGFLTRKSFEEINRLKIEHTEAEQEYQEQDRGKVLLPLGLLFDKGRFQAVQLSSSGSSYSNMVCTCLFPPHWRVKSAGPTVEIVKRFLVPTWMKGDAIGSSCLALSLESVELPWVQDEDLFRFKCSTCSNYKAEVGEQFSSCQKKHAIVNCWGPWRSKAKFHNFTPRVGSMICQYYFWQTSFGANGPMQEFPSCSESDRIGQKRDSQQGWCLEVCKGRELIVASCALKYWGFRMNG